jgi:hypothetical protein
MELTIVKNIPQFRISTFCFASWNGCYKSFRCSKVIKPDLAILSCWVYRIFRVIW